MFAGLLTLAVTDLEAKPALIMGRSGRLEEILGLTIDGDDSA